VYNEWVSNHQMTQTKTMTEEERRALERILRLQGNIKVYGGITIGMLLLIVFFTFPHVLDHAPLWAFGAEMGFAALLVLALVFGNRISFALARLLLRGPAYQALFARLSPRDVNEDPDKLARRLAGQG